MEANYQQKTELKITPLGNGNYSNGASDLSDEKIADLKGQVAAISKSQAVIEFGLDGIVTDANENFLKALGYTLDEIKGKHHRMFCDPAVVNSNEYRNFWEKLNRGEFDSGEYKRIGKGGKTVWIQASYNPILDGNRKPFKVVKYATDITQQKLKEADLAALSKSQAVIEFNLDGTVVHANDNFLNALGYRADEVRGKHHSMFCDPAYVASPQYKEFWAKLNSGQFDSGQYLRIGKGGKEVWIQAAYNPVFDFEGKPFKVVKYAVDVTAEKLLSLKQEAAAAQMTSMMENAPVNVMFAGLDFKLVYINPKSRDTLRTLEKLLPRPVDQLIGGSIDIFHKNPAHQRAILADDRKLPLRSKIKLGDQTLDLLVSAIYDGNKKYIGPMVTWEIITDKLALVSTLDETANSLASAAAELTATATQLSGNATKTSQESNNAAAASEEVARGVQTVATNTEEMAASIKEIARSSSEGANMSKDTLKKAQDTNRTITQLGSSSLEIGNVIKVISSIAQQTNLLALNATIEAARAGDAGKGFAVVANEVKELAKQTAKATDEITSKISAIQNDSKGAVDAMGSIGQGIEKLNSITMTIAAAVEEQTATTNEVSRVVQESRKAVDGIALTVKAVSQAAGESSTGAGQTLVAAKGLTDLAEKLRALVKRVQV